LTILYGESISYQMAFLLIISLIIKMKVIMWLKKY